MYMPLRLKVNILQPFFVWIAFRRNLHQSPFQQRQTKRRSGITPLLRGRWSRLNVPPVPVPVPSPAGSWRPPMPPLPAQNGSGPFPTPRNGARPRKGTPANRFKEKVVPLTDHQRQERSYQLQHRTLFDGFLCWNVVGWIVYIYIVQYREHKSSFHGFFVKPWCCRGPF